MNALKLAAVCIIGGQTIAPSLAAESACPSDSQPSPLLASNLGTIIPNFEAVNPGLCRGSAPTSPALKRLASSGVRTIIDLRLGSGNCRREQNESKKLGITYIHLPMGYTEPSGEQLKKFLDVVENPVNQPVYVHCRQGADRTGTLIGVYRVIVDKWSVPKAYSEMRRHHFKPWLYALKRAVRDCQPGQVTLAPSQANKNG